MIGLNTATHFFGVVLAGLLTPSIIARSGRVSIFIGLLLSGLSVAAFPWGNGPFGWFTLRLLAGAGGAIAMIALESLINLRSNALRRARDFAFYASSVGIGFALGSFVGLHLFAFEPRLSFVLGGGVTLAACLVVPFLPAFPKQAITEASPSLIRAPFLSLGSAWCQGFLEAGMLALLPLYLRAIGLQDGASGTLLGGILIGVLVFQVPIGWLADRLGRERVLLVCYVVVAVGLAAVPFVGQSAGLSIALLVIGIFSGAFYPLGLALLGERLPASDVARANALYLSVNCTGSLISPLISGPLMERYGPQSMFWTAEAAVLGVMLMWVVARRRNRPIGEIPNTNRIAA
ncbi:MAG: MFS transporter [Planctomycetes bacterium]|nr:MFS transporter [Planctomycetota bacterium]